MMRRQLIAVWVDSDVADPDHVDRALRAAGIPCEIVGHSEECDDSPEDEQSALYAVSVLLEVEGDDKGLIIPPERLASQITREAIIAITRNRKR